jgi:hypothetical protein
MVSFCHYASGAGSLCTSVAGNYPWAHSVAQPDFERDPLDLGIEVAAGLLMYCVALGKSFGQHDHGARQAKSSL